MMSDPGSPPQIEVTIAAPPELVWRALREPELLRRWHGWHEGGLDEEIRIIYLNEAIEDPVGFVLQLGEQDRFSLHPTTGGTIVRVTRPPRGGESEWEAYYDDIVEGWQTFLEQLRFAIERHELADRRTIMHSGTLRAKDPIVDALGLSDVATLPPGSPYQASIQTGEKLSGQVWARRPNQLALTVDSYGDGLLILAEQPVVEHRPEGGAMMVLTAYGLDDPAFEQVRDGWSRWWADAVQ
jgi:hypothetical protein